MERKIDHFALPLRGKGRRNTGRSGILSQTGQHRAPKFRIGSRTSSQRAGFKKRRGGRK